MRTTSLLIVLIVFFVVGCGEQQGTNVVEAIEQADHFRPARQPEGKMNQRHTVYVPAYSHIYTSKDKREVMAVTLSIRNTDFANSLWVKKVLYYNTQGDLIESFLPTLHVLDPMASIDFVVNLTDMRGGSGANFIIEWAGVEELTTPIFQAVMVNVNVPKAFAFIADGVTIE